MLVEIFDLITCFDGAFRYLVMMIDPVEWTGGTDGNEDFTVNITAEELETLKDASREIRFENVFRWCLPVFGDDDETSLFQFQAARMRNCSWMTMAGVQSITPGTKYLQVIMLQGSMVFVLLRCLWVINQ